MIVRNALAGVIGLATGIEQEPSSIPGGAKGAGAEAWADLAVPAVLKQDVEALTVERFRLLLAQTASALRHWSTTYAHRSLAKELLRLCDIRGVLPLFLGPDASRLSSLSGSIRPERTSNPDQRRVGYPTESPHREQGISTHLTSRMVSYFVHFGADLPESADGIRNELTAHDAHELAFFLGHESLGGATCRIPIFDETECNPRDRVAKPFALKRHQCMVYDARSPHFAYAPPGSVALYVAASPDGLYTDPSAFRTSNLDRVPGVSYPFGDSGVRKMRKTPSGHDALPVTDENEGRAMYRLLGSRLRRQRDIRGISVAMLESPKAVVYKNYVGKLESGMVPHVRVGALLRVASAMDLPPEDLLSQAPSQVVGLPPLPDHPVAAPLHDDFDWSRFVLGAAVVVPRRLGAKLCLRNGAGDAVLLALSGAAELIICPDPLSLLLSLSSTRGKSEIVDVRHSQYPSITREELEGEIQRGHLICQRLRRHEACQFNTARPHMVVADRAAKVLAVVTRQDRHLPEEWVR